MARELQLTFDINTINHLGVKLYSTIPPMLAELVANAWDADAHNVWISLSDHDKDKEIIVTDDGSGMSFDELNDKFLKVGRNRRIELNEDKTTEGRPILGKKGLGKLSMFGIGRDITVTTVCNHKITSFRMNYDEIKDKGNSYRPAMLKTEEDTDKESGTSIVIGRIRRKSGFDIESIERGLRSRFHIFSEDFRIHINDSILINTPEGDAGQYQFSWSFPDDYENELQDDVLQFAREKNIKGHVYTAYTPLGKETQGIVLFSRGKLVQENKTFNKRGNDNFFQYMTGSFDVDFIDADMEIDNCSTDRKSLAWDNCENDDLPSLNKLMEAVVDVSQKKWRRARKDAKKKRLENRGHNIDEWLSSLTQTERPLAKKLIMSIIENDSKSEEQAGDYIGYIKDMYGFEGFREFTAQLNEMDALNNEDAIKLLTDWNMIEAKEYAKISTGRIATIEQFEKFVRNDASENKIIQKFLEEFPWLLDPKMSKFEREVTYTRLLKESFDDSEKPDHDRRLDFLCTNDAGNIHIIELKRPSIKITVKELQQITEYVEFIETHFPTTAGNVSGYLISDNMTYGPGAEKMKNALESQNIFVKSYSDLLSEARRYNEDIYKAYQEISEIREKESHKSEL